jgi:hypothetical protein
VEKVGTHYFVVYKQSNPDRVIFKSELYTDRDEATTQGELKAKDYNTQNNSEEGFGYVYEVIPASQTFF